MVPGAKSDRHTFRYWIMSSARLSVPPLGQAGGYNHAKAFRQEFFGNAWIGSLVGRNSANRPSILVPGRGVHVEVRNLGKRGERLHTSNHTTRKREIVGKGGAVAPVEIRT